MNHPLIVLTTIILALTLSFSAASKPKDEGPKPKKVIIVNDATTPIPVTVEQSEQTIVEMRFVGVTTATSNGAVFENGRKGIAAMNLYCEREYGEGARASTLDDALLIAPGVDAAAPFPLSWLAPGDGPLEAVSTGNGYVAMDMRHGEIVGGEFARADEALLWSYCNKYDDNRRSGLSTPAIHSSTCCSSAIVAIACSKSDNVQRPIACSAPVAIPVR